MQTDSDCSLWEFRVKIFILLFCLSHRQIGFKPTLLEEGRPFLVLSIQHSLKTDNRLLFLKIEIFKVSSFLNDLPNHEQTRGQRTLL